MIKIGITERGDAGIDFSWIEKLKNVSGAIIISKCSNTTLENALINNQDKIIYHATCTGLGGSILEPYVPDYIHKLIHLENIIKRGFNPNRIVLRIDPIISNDLYKEIYNDDYKHVLDDILMFAFNNNIKRIRYSYIDLYQHVKDRFNNSNIKNFHALTKEEINDFENFFDQYEKQGLIINSCGELNVKNHRKCGCISKEDFKILGLNENDCLDAKYKQRFSCLCCANKTELLNNKNRCPNECLYCYWKDKLIKFECKLVFK